LQVGFEIARFLFARPSGAQPGIGLQSLAVGDPSRQHATDETLDPASNFAGRGFASSIAAAGHRWRPSCKSARPSRAPSPFDRGRWRHLAPRAAPARSNEGDTGSTAPRRAQMRANPNVRSGEWRVEAFRLAAPRRPKPGSLGSP
jgi:hypothetical protein